MARRQIIFFTRKNFSIGLDQAFALGNLSYFNGSIKTNTLTSVVSIDITINFKLPNLTEKKEVLYQLAINNTENVDGDPVASADYVNLSNGNSASNITVNLGGKDYALKILGFGTIDRATNNIEIVPEFHVFEQASASAQLLAKFVPINSLVLIGTTGNDILNGGVSNDELTGFSGDDILKGNRGNDLLLGGLGKDKLYGGLGNDTLDGGAGRDLLVGGTGKDIFRLSNTFTVDSISDFSVTDDTIELQNSLFSSFENIGPLSPDMFRTGAGVTKAADSNDYLIYNLTTGELYYDDDGNGTDSVAVKIAILGTNTHPVLTNADFIVA